MTDPVPGDNTGTDTNPVGPQADLSISKVEHPDPYVPGAPLSYTIVVSNAGPSERDQCPGAGCVAAAAGGIYLDLHAERRRRICGTPTGTGNIDALVTLPAGSQSTFTRHRHSAGGDDRHDDQHGDGDAAAGVTDPVPGNNAATDTNPVGPQADLAISKSSTPKPYVPGAPLTYTVMVSNAGPSDVINARVQDALPPALAAFGWTCTPSGAGASCGTANGSGDIDALVTLPVGTSAPLR